MRWLVAGALVLTGVQTALPARAGAADAPAVVPALRSWQSGSGEFALRSGSRIVVDARYADALGADAKVFSADLAAEGVRRLPVVTGGEPGDGDLFLTRSSTGSAAGASDSADAYTLAVAADRVTLSGAGAEGVFNGEQSIEQILATAPGHDRIPVGTGADAPARSGERGLMVDAAREFWPVADLQQTIRRMAWLKLDTLHWHLTDSEAFRLRLPGYDGLAASRSYRPEDVRAVLDYARRYHVRVVPEMDIPGHSTAITAYRPALRWDCPAMNQIIHIGRVDPGFTVDITKPQNVAWMDGLVTAFLQEFDAADAPVVHLGGDETPDGSLQSQCGELASYAAARGYAKTEDVFLAYENHLDDLLRAHGRTMQIWGWWPQVGGGSSVTVHHDVRVQAWLGDEADFLAQGYPVVVSNEHSRLYVVPKAVPGTGNGNYIPDDSALYSSYAPASSPNVAGVEMAEWGDGAYEQPASYFAQYLRRPLQNLASATWSGPQAGADYLDYEALADRIGDPPGVPASVETNAVVLSGSSYFSGAGVMGLDLGGGHASRVSGVRLLPASGGSADLGALVGGVVQGCTDGPAAGCHELARIQSTPTLDWLTLPAADTSTAYRWLRYVAPAGAASMPARVQYLAPGAAGAEVSVRPDAVTLRNTTGLPLTPVALSVTGAVAEVQPGAVPPNGAVTVPLHPDPVAAPGPHRIAAQLTYRQADSGAAQFTAHGATMITVPYAALSDAFDNLGTTDDSDPETGNLDGAQSSFSRQHIPAPGSTVTGPDGLDYTWPSAAQGDPDNMLAQGQSIPLSGSGSRVGILATATYAPAGGLTAPVTLTYTDGTTATATLTVPDWSAGPTAQAPAAVASTVVNASGHAQAVRTADVYSLSVPADPTRQLASVTLPALPGYLNQRAPQLHVFALSVG